METVEKQNLAAESQRPLVAGKDILEVAGRLGVAIKPGPLFGKIIKIIEGARDNGDIRDREEAIQRLEKVIKETAE